MRSVGVRELKEHTSEILRRVRDEGEIVEVTLRGQVIARVVPAGQTSMQQKPGDQEELAAFWERWDKLSAEISADLPDDVSAVDIVREGRRDL
jgi:prevent-host-death family protein